MDELTQEVAAHARAVGWTRHTAGSTFTWRSRGAHCVGGGAVLALGQDAGSAPGQLMSQEARARRVRLDRPRLQNRLARLSLNLDSF